MVRKNTWFVVIFVVLVTAAVATAAFLIKDYYQPVARIEVDALSSGMKPLGEIQWNTDQNDENYVETQTQLLQSESLAIGVIRHLHLDENPEFVSKKTVEKYRQSGGGASEAGWKPSPSEFYLQEQFDLANRTPLESMALGAFKGKLAVTNVHNTRVIEVSFTCHDAQLCQDIVNSLVTRYVDQSFRTRQTSTMQASEWLGAQIENLRRKVEEANQAVSEYQKQYNLVEVDERDVPLTQLMYEANRKLADSEATRIEQEAYVRMIDEGRGDTVPTVRNDQLLQTLMARYGETRGQLARARAIYGDENSNVKKLHEESLELQAQVDAERARVVGQVRTTYAAARDAEQMEFSAREKIRAQMGDASSHMTQYHILRNEAVANAELYNTLKGRLIEAGIYAGLRSSNIHIVDLAPKLLRATGPHRNLIIPIGFMVSGILALVLSFVRESFDNTVRTPDDIKEWVGLPSLAMLPPTNGNGRSGKQDRPALKGFAGAGSITNGHGPTPEFFFNVSRSVESEAIRDLRTALMIPGQGTPPAVILVTSALGGEGKTTVAMNLAAAFAQCGKTCLIDGDLHRPMVAKAFGLRTKGELSDVINGTSPLETALASVPGVPNLSVLPVNVAPANPTDLIASPRMRELTASLRTQFAYIVIDSPPVIPYSDARILSSLADVVLLVGRYESTTRRAITRCLQLLDEVRAPVIGVVVNGIKVASADYHYYNYGYTLNINGKPSSYYSSKESAHSSERPAPTGEDIKKKGAHA